MCTLMYRTMSTFYGRRIYCSERTAYTVKHRKAGVQLMVVHEATFKANIKLAISPNTVIIGLQSKYVFETWGSLLLVSNYVCIYSTIVTHFEKVIQ